MKQPQSIDRRAQAGALALLALSLACASVRKSAGQTSLPDLAQSLSETRVRAIDEAAQDCIKAEADHSPRRYREIELSWCELASGGWDARNTLTTVLDNGSELGRYDYDRNGLRVKRSAQGQQVEYVLDDKFILSEHDGSTSAHSMKRRYHYAAQPLAESEVSGASRFTTWLNTDAQGSVTDATQTDGTVRTGRQYDAWGNYRNSTAPQSGDPKLGYTGHQFDPETGLVYARARYYDPEIGIFLSRDPREAPVGDAPWLHRYAYVRSNPLRYTDPNGLCPFTLCEDALLSYSLVRPLLPSSMQGYGDRALVALLTTDAQVKSGLALAQNRANEAIDSASFAQSNGSTLGNADAAAQSAVAKVATGAVLGTLQMLDSSPRELAAGFVQQHQQAGQALQKASDSSLPLEQRVLAGSEVLGVASQDLLIVAGTAQAAGFKGPRIGKPPPVPETVIDAVPVGLSNPIPDRLARVIPGDLNPITLGRPGSADVFVTAADDIAGMTPAQIAERLTIPASKSFTVIEFATPAEGLASPVFRTDPGFIGGGRTAGGAREFVLPNGPIPADSTVGRVGP